MSLEKFARERLMRDLPGFRKNGLKHWLRVIDRVKFLEGMCDGNLGFIPDGTRLRRQPPHNKEYLVQDEWDKWDITLELWEIEDTWKITEAKMGSIQMMAHDLFDMSTVFTEIWICNRYGTGKEKIWDIRDEIDGGGKMDFHEPSEWMSDGEWISETRQLQPAH
jgi:hypothetical protein